MKRVIFSSLDKIRSRASPFQREGRVENKKILNESDIGEPKKLESHHKDLIFIEAIKHVIIRSLVIILLISEAFLFLRIVLQAMGANPNSIFSGFIYIVSGIFLIPFFDIFPQLQGELMPGRSTFDAAAIIALFSYLLLLPLFMLIVYLVCNILKTRRQVNEISKKETPVDPTVVDDVMV